MVILVVQKLNKQIKNIELNVSDYSLRDINETCRKYGFEYNADRQTITLLSVEVTK